MIREMTDDERKKYFALMATFTEMCHKALDEGHSPPSILAALAGVFASICVDHGRSRDEVTSFIAIVFDRAKEYYASKADHDGDGNGECDR